jgi:hypothetical protein
MNHHEFSFTDKFFLDGSTAETIDSGLKNIASVKTSGNLSQDALNWLRLEPVPEASDLEDSRSITTPEGLEDNHRRLSDTEIAENEFLTSSKFRKPFAKVFSIVNLSRQFCSVLNSKTLLVLQIKLTEELTF